MGTCCLILKLSAVLWSGAALADNITTYQAFSPAAYRPYLHEGTPYYAPLQTHPAILSATMASVDAGTGLLVWKLSAHHPKLGAVAFLALGSYRAYIAQRNIRHMQWADDQIAANTLRRIF